MNISRANPLTPSSQAMTAIGVKANHLSSNTPQPMARLKAPAAG